VIRSLPSVLAVSCLAIAVGDAGAQARKLEVYLSADMEGVAGTVPEDQLVPGGFVTSYNIALEP
jgi:hypothetical protein